MRRTLLLTVIFLSIGLLVFGCARSVKSSKSTVAFQPKTIYDVTYDKMWSTVKRVLETERIGIVSSDKEEGRIVTDSVQGKTRMVLLVPVSTRYSYTINFEKIDKDRTRLGIICKIEGQTKYEGWGDWSKDYKAEVIRLENWLYQQIEKSL